MSLINLQKIMTEDNLISTNINYICGDIRYCGTFDPFTVIYMLNSAITALDNLLLAQIFNER